jgi:hypothetical protein
MVALVLPHLLVEQLPLTLEAVAVVYILAVVYQTALGALVVVVRGVQMLVR